MDLPSAADQAARAAGTAASATVSESFIV
jgi:hypothetical protein